MKIFFSVGEPSGDLHGANLIRRLQSAQPSIQTLGFGGPRMQAAGFELHHDLTRLAIMGFARVAGHLKTFAQLLGDADRCFREQRPDAVVLIDYPGFNWWIARRAKAHGIPVFYYGVPQMWAWAGWRVRKMRRLVDHVLCKLPFEADWYQQRGCRATFVGHPYYDELVDRQLDETFLASHGGPRPLITILPGSRRQEVENNLAWLLRTAEKVGARVPDARFAIASFNQEQAELARTFIDPEKLPVEIHVGRTPELIHLAHSCLACSGSVSLELLYHCKPTVIHYRVNRYFFWLAQRYLVKVKYITLVNLLADDNPFTDRATAYDPHSPQAEHIPFPEYPTCEDRSDAMAAHLIQWLEDPAAHGRRVAQLQSLKRRFAFPGASQFAARYLLEHLPADSPAKAA